MKKQNTPVVEAEVAIPAETTPAVVETPKVKKTPVFERSYILKNAPSITPKGKQRAIVLGILKDAKGPLSVGEIAKQAEVLGLQATAGVKASTAWHLHQMTLIGIAEVVNPTSQPAPAESEVAEAQTMLEASGD